MRGKKANMMIKIDLEKAFDKVEWSFIRKTLIFFNLPTNLINLIMSCVSSSSAVILVNGDRTGFFKPSRGIRQGGPISPYIFILCMEMLSREIESEVRKNNWQPIKVARRGPSLSHLFFADDLILMSRADSKNVATINKVLAKLCEKSGQSINYSKSKLIFSKNCGKELKSNTSSTLSIKKSTYFGKYLGFPIFTKSSTLSDYQFIIDNLSQKLAGWKSKLLNIAGRTTLAMACLNNIPMHIMQYVKLPTTITKKIDQIQRNFIWGSTRDKRKLHMIDWKTLANKKVDRGLGGQRAEVKNNALLAKLAWRAYNNSSSPWAALLINKYSPQGHKTTNIIRKNNNYSRTWKGLTNGWEVCMRGLKWSIGKGETTSLWYDRWLDNGSTMSEAIQSYTRPLDGSREYYESYGYPNY